jgi:hypothetical protein
MYGLGSNNAFDNYLLPDNLLVDGAVEAANELGVEIRHANHFLAPTQK